MIKVVTQQSKRDLLGKWNATQEKTQQFCLIHFNHSSGRGSADAEEVMQILHGALNGTAKALGVSFCTATF